MQGRDFFNVGAAVMAALALTPAAAIAMDAKSVVDVKSSLWTVITMPLPLCTKLHGEPLPTSKPQSSRKLVYVFVQLKAASRVPYKLKLS